MLIAIKKLQNLSLIRV